MHKEYVVRRQKVGGEEHYCCEETGFWHNVDVWSKSDEFLSAHESRKTCHDQMTKNQAFVSRKIADLNTQRFMGMCVWLVEKNGQHKATRMRNKFLPISIGSVKGFIKLDYVHTELHKLSNIMHYNKNVEL